MKKYKNGKFILAAFALLSLTFISCEKKNVVFLGTSQTVDEKWEEKIDSKIQIVFNPNDFTFEETEENHIERSDANGSESEETLFKRKGEYDGNPKKNGQLILYYNGESKNDGEYYAYVDDIIFTVQDGCFFYGWDESIQMKETSVIEREEKESFKAAQRALKKEALQSAKNKK